MSKLAPMAPGGGNTKTPPVRISASKKWVFTLHNYSQKDIGSIQEVLGKKGKYFFAEELGEQNSPHLQGFVEFKKKSRPFECELNKEIHWEKMKGDLAENFDYCRKESGATYTNFEEDDMPDVIVDPLEGIELYEWQKKVIEIIATKPDRRTINWFWEEKGNTGKTSLAFHLCMKSERTIYVAGKAADMKFAIAACKTPPKVVIFDYVRSLEDFISYEGLESIKNGIFFSGKYEGKMHIQNPPHIIVLANFAPDLQRCSKDRWNVVNIKNLS